MRRVERLPEDLVNKIAAGEVVERPASVVKELVENAVDAGASSIRVEIEKGGKELCRVRDDGCGMSRQDARLALERHATSKLRELADLSAIATHGFRGEALPSIASVSHLTLWTRDDSGPAGTEIEVRDGRLVHVRDAGHPVGTSVEVRELFAEVPARRKFLRADSTEAAHVAEAVTLVALARPGLGFSLRSGGRSVIDAPAVAGLRERLFQLFGGEWIDSLLPVEGREAWARVSGFVARPSGPGSARAGLRLFVNGRAVRDRLVSKAVLDAYRSAGAGERRAGAFLCLEVPMHMVDVNVHPAKTEVRFAEGRTVFAAVEKAVRDALSSPGRALAPREATQRVAEAVERYLAEAPAVRDAGPARRLALGEADVRSAPAPGAATPPSGMQVLGQHRSTYIVVTDGEDLLLVDQHTAHERVRFEALLDRVASRSVESQALLLPLVLALPAPLRPVLRAETPALLELGFDVEPFGGEAVRVRAVPALLGARDPARVIERALRDVLEREASDWAVAEPRERLAASLACHSAVRAGQALAPEAMQAIVRDLLRTKRPALCPHGRPTFVRIPRDEVSRWFGRTGWRRS